MRKILLPLLAIMTIFALSSCYKVEGNITIKDDDTISGIINLGLPKNTDPVQQQQFFRSFGIGQVPQISIQPWAEGDWTGKKLTFTDLPKEIYDTKLKLIKIEHTGEVYKVTGKDINETLLPKLTTQATKSRRALPITPTPEWKMSFTFPFAVTADSTGVTIDGNTAVVTNSSLVNGSFTIVAGKTKKVADPSSPKFGDPPERITGEKVWPIKTQNRNPLPLYVFAAMVILGTSAMLFGWFGSVNNANKNSDEKVSLGKKPSKKKKAGKKRKK